MTVVLCFSDGRQSFLWHLHLLDVFAACMPFHFEPDPQQSDLPGSLRFGRHKTDVTIFTNPAFIAKNQRFESNPPVVIKSLRSFIASQEEPDNELCPVRALLYYLKRTQPRRGNCFRLFLPYKLGQGDNKLQPD